MLSRNKWSVLAIGCSLMVAQSAIAQAQRQPGRAIPSQAVPNQPAQQTPAAPRGQMENHDAFFAEWLTLDNQNEIELANLALQKTSSSDVKQFAEKMIADHQKLNEQLARFTGNQVPRDTTAQRTTQPADGQAPQQAQASSGQRRFQVEQSEPQHRTVARVTDQGEIPGQPRHQGTMLSLKQELADQCLASARQELDRKSGREFDNCYMHMQIGAHAYVIDAMEVFQRHASPELQQALAAGEQTAQQHLQMAKKIVESHGQSADRQ